MTKLTKTTRSSRNNSTNPTKEKFVAPALHKIFYISEKLLADSTNQLRLERFYHPGKNKQTLFITNANRQQIMEVLEFTEPRRSWLIDNNVCSNGRIYLTIPIDATFLALHHIRKYCTQKACALEHIHLIQHENNDNDDDGYIESTRRLMYEFIKQEDLNCVATVTDIDKMTYCKYNAEKTLAWLALKTQRIAVKLKELGVHCGHSALSQNYARSEKISDEIVQDNDYLRMASDIVGGYIDIDLHEELEKYLELKIETNETKNQTNAVTKTDAVNKRKSLTKILNTENKKIKLDEETDATMLNDESLNESKNSSIEILKSSPIRQKITPSKERTLSAKEKALAKGAKGTKSISIFFKVK